MSAVDDIDKSKDDDDIPNKDSVQLDDDKKSDGSIKLDSSVENSDKMADTVGIGNNESNTADIAVKNSVEASMLELDKTDTVIGSGDHITDTVIGSGEHITDTVIGSGDHITDTVIGSGDHITSDKPTVSTEDTKVGEVQLDIKEDELAKENLDNGDNVKISGELDDDEELELRWEEDDLNMSTPNNDTLKTDLKSVGDEKTIQEDLNELLNTEDFSMKLNEGELLQNEEPEDSEMMEVDTGNSITSGTIKEVMSIHESAKAQETEQLKTIDTSKADDNSYTEMEEQTQAPENDEFKTVSKPVQDITDNPNNDKELNVSMDIDHSDITVENSPILAKTTKHGLSKPDVMLEIPTQELIDIDAILDSPNDSRNSDSMVTNDGEANEIHKNDTDLEDELLNESMPDEPAVTVREEIEGTEMDKSEENGEHADIGGEINNADGEADKMNMENEATTFSTELVAIKASTFDEAQPSTSNFCPEMNLDTSDDGPDMNDSLGLLAESSRVMDDDDYQEDDEDGDGDEDDDYDQDESSNQMTAEHSEDSNAQHSETEPARVELERDVEYRDDREERETDDLETEVNQCEEDFTIDEVDIEENDGVGALDENPEIEAKRQNNDEGEKSLTTEIKIAEVFTRKKTEKDDTIKSTDLEQQNQDTVKENIKIEKEDAIDTKENKIEHAVKSNEGQVEDDIKKETDDSNQIKVTVKKETEDRVKLRKEAIEEPLISSVSSVTSNDDDDVIEQPIEIETVKLSDDEDEDEPSAENQEVKEKSCEMTKQLEETLLEKITEVEKVTFVEKVTTLKKTNTLQDNTKVEEFTELETTKELQKTTDLLTTTELHKTTDLQKTTELEKTTESEMTSKETQEETMESDSSTIDLTPDPTKNTEDCEHADSRTSPKSSPSKLKNLTLSHETNKNLVNIVELGESSSEDEVLEVTKEPEDDRKKSRLQTLLEATHKPPPLPAKDVTSVNIPTGIDIMSTSAGGGNTSQIVTKEGEVVISGVSKPPRHKPARLNTSEVTIKTASNTEQTLVIPEMKANEQSRPEPSKPRLSLEIFSLDSDEEDTSAQEKPEKPKKKAKKCINSACSSGLTVLQAADVATAAYYDASRKKRPVVCQSCAQAVITRKEDLVAGIKNLTPLLQLDMSTISQDLVEILDSESEDEDSQPVEQQPKDTIGEEAAKFLEDNLTDLLNESWKKYNLDERLKETQDELDAEILKLEEESKEINEMLMDCQRVTDKLRSDLYATFEHRIQELPPLLIYETPDIYYIGSESDFTIKQNVVEESKISAKRKMLSANESPAKRPAIPLGYAPLDDSKLKSQENKPLDSKMEDDKDISVVKLSAEAAPADLPPPGDLTRPPLRVGMSVYAMRNAFGPWFKGRVLEIMPKSGNPSMFTTCRVKFDHKIKNNGKILPARCMAYAEPADVRMTIGTRVIALYKDSNNRESYYSGVVAEIPNPVNNYRYLVFFDDGYAQYVGHPHTRLVCECSPLVWEEVHPLSREFVREYLMAYPERPMVRLHEGQHLKTEWDGKWWPSRVEKVDASLAQVIFISQGRREWIYRGSTRLAPLYLELRAAERHRQRPMPRSKQPRSNMMPYVEYTRSDEQANKAQETQPTPVAITTQLQNDEMRRQRAVAKKSTSVSMPPLSHGAPHGPGGAPVPAGNLDNFSSRVVYYTPKNAVRPYKLVPHKCSPKCKRSDVLSLKDLRTYNPLAKPLLSGWERQLVRYKGQKEVMYRAPCGRRLRNMKELHRYLRMTDSELPVDLFDFYHATHCLAEFVLNKCLVGKKDLSHGKENVPVPCVNYYDDSLPEFCSYNTERTPTSGVPLNLDPEFLCGCDCTDDCEDKSKCACWKMTLEGARTIGLEGVDVGYEYKRLPEPLPSGIYECNSRCKCKQTCLNRVAQHPLQLKLQVFKTLNRGWGIRALNDVPKGSFLCVYAGNLLTDATANLDGLNEGDEYLAELDYIEVVEQMKEGYEEDIPDADKKLDKKESSNQEESEEESSSSEEEGNASNDKDDYDFRPGHIPGGVEDFNKRLRRREKKEKDAKEAEEKEKEKENKGANPEEDCITISDDDEVREPSRFTAKPGMGGNDFVSKYRSVRTLFGEDEACYIMDAKVQGNIGRYLNHSCSPNVFVQNVFVDTHDPRFPWVAFFALSHIKAGTELTWNYNYDVGSVPGKILYCYCEAPTCRGRLL